MNLNLFENFKKDIKSNDTIKNFIDELSDFLKGNTSFPTQDKDNNFGANEQLSYSQENVIDKNKIKQNKRSKSQTK